MIKSNSVSVHQSNLQLLLTEIYKTVNGLNPSFMAEVFVTKDVPYNLLGSNKLALPRARTNLYGIDTIRFVRFCQEKSKSPNHWRFLKEILKLSERLTAAVNCVKILLRI